MRNLTQWLAYLESIHPLSIDMGLDRVKKVASSLSLDWSNSKIITVGGTNGKGTTCSVLDSVLRQQGYSVAIYRSPHLVDYRERVTLNGEMQPHSEYVQAFETVEQARGHISLTYFEFGTLAAFVMMQKWQPDFVLLEVGLGGRLDATNIVDNDCAIITSIGIDHQAFLGNTRESIATEKAGIFRRSKPVIIGDTNPPAPLRQIGSDLHSQLYFAGADFQHIQISQQGWNWHGKHLTFTRLPMPKVPVQNVSTAFAALEQLGIDITEKQAIETCQTTSLPGRRQVIQTQPTVLLDVAHNPHAAADLVEYIKSTLALKSYLLVVGMLADKDYCETLSQFSDLSAKWFLATTQGDRGLEAESLQQVLPKNSQVSCHKNVIHAYKSAMDFAEPDDGVIVFGSFLTVAEVLAYTTNT